MDCQNRIIHTVEEGDSLYLLARRYRTTVTELILGNPGANPYDLRIGMKLYVCPGGAYEPPEDGNLNGGGMYPGDGGSMNGGGMRPGDGGSMDGMAWRTEEMRLAWLELLYWTRMYMMSVDADAGDQQAVEERLLETADAIADVFAESFPLPVVRRLRNLLVEHVELTGEVIRARKADEEEDYEQLIRAWYENANQIAELLADQNPYFSGKEVKNLLLNLLDMTREAMEQQANGAYGQSIDTFRDLKELVLTLADQLARGLTARG